MYGTGRQTDGQHRNISDEPPKFDLTQKASVQKQILGLACVSMPVKLYFLSINST